MSLPVRLDHNGKQGKGVFKMSIKDLQTTIKVKEGFILSTDTLNLEHLLPSAYDLIVAYNMRTELKKEIESVFVNTDKDEEEKLSPTFHNQYYSSIEIPENKKEDASYLWNEDIFNYFNNISPNGYYFGNTLGDEACIGWFKSEENEDY